MVTCASPVLHGQNPLRPKALAALSAARSVFLESGYDAASMDAIARQAGISKATLYAHFANKEDLFEALIRHECQGIKAMLTPPDPNSRSVEEELLRVARELRQTFWQKEGLAVFRIIVPVAHRFPRLARIFYEEGPETAIRQISEFLKAGCDAGHLRIPDLEVAANQFLALISDDVRLSGTLTLPGRWAWDDEALIRSGVSMFMRFYSA